MVLGNVIVLVSIKSMVFLSLCLNWLFIFLDKYMLENCFFCRFFRLVVFKIVDIFEVRLVLKM